MINSVSPMEKTCLVGGDKGAFDHWISNADRTKTIVLVDSSNESLDSVINECNFNGFFVQIYAKFGKDVIRSGYKGASYCFCDNPKIEMLKSSDRMILLAEMADLDWVCDVNPNIKVENAVAQFVEFKQKQKEAKEQMEKADLDAMASNDDK